MTRVVIVGAGLGGLRAAEQLRAARYAGDIVVLGDEQVHAYNRPPLSKAALTGEAAHEALAYRHRSSVADVRWRLGERVVRSDLNARTVTTQAGEKIGYDALFAATGVSARRLAIRAPRSWRHIVRTLGDAAALRPLLQPGSRVVILGAGLIGCEVAASARTRGCDVRVVELAPVPMLGPLGELLGRELQRRHEQHGTRFHLGAEVAEIHGSADAGEAERTGREGVREAGAAGEDAWEAERTGREGAREAGAAGRQGAREVELTDGTRLLADVVVEAVGSQPNTGWLAGNGLDLADGVCCDNQMAMGGRPEAVAVGDVARFPNPMFDEIPRRVEHWNIPAETARRAARTVAAALGGLRAEGVFTPMPAFWSDQYGIRLQSFGMPALGRDDTRVLEGDLAGEVAVGYYRDDVLVGVALLGLGRSLMKYRDLVEASRRAGPAEPAA